MSPSSPFSTILLFLSALALSSNAATHYVRVNGSGAKDGTSWSDAFNSLQDAINAATSGDQIWVKKGTYYPDEGAGQTDDDRDSSFFLKSKVEIYGGFPTNIVSPNFAARQPAVNLTILSGDLDQNDGSDGSNNSGNAYHVLTASGSVLTDSTVLDGFIITGGHANGSNLDDRGAGLFCQNSASPDIANCIFRDNNADWGGAVRNESSAAPTLTNCLFKNNNAIKGGGGTSNGNPSSPVFTNCAFLTNQSGNTGGGARDAASTPTYLNCTFRGNTAATTGGAIHNHFATITLTNSILWDNTAAGNSTSQTASLGSSSAATPTSSHCLVENWSATDLSDPANSIDGTNPANAPRFASADSGDLRLLPGSPAIDSGDNLANSILTDLYRNPRFINTDIDLGATEAQAFYYVKISGSDADAGDSWADAYRTLQKALTNVALEPGDIILVAAGIYYPDEIDGTDSDDRTDTFALPSGVAIIGNFPPAGGDTPNPQSYSTTLSGKIDQDVTASDNSINILTADGSDSLAILDGFIIDAGYGDAGSGLDCSNSAVPKLANCVFQNNHAANNGGAVYNAGSSSPSFFSCTFQYNDSNGGGGAVYNISSSSPTFTDCTFLANSSFTSGGAVTNTNSSSPYFINCNFEGNATNTAGGAVSSAIFSATSFSDCTFLGNNSGSQGGAVYSSSSSLSCSDCSFAGNSASISGGAVFTNTESTFTACSFKINSASTGAGGAVYSSAPASFTNCSFQGNEADNNAGGLANNVGGAVSSFSSSIFTNCSFQGNEAASAGGAVYNNSSATSFSNCILWDNTASGTTGSPDSSISGGNISTFSHCLIHNWNATTLDASGSGGTGNLDGTLPANDPLFVNSALANLRLQNGSPAINIGDSAANFLPTDLDGNPRIHNLIIDLGAYENQGGLDTIWLTDPDGDGTPWGVEHALGTDPTTSDSGHPDNLVISTVNASGHPTLTFGRNPDADSDTIWILKRSTTLPGPFDEIYRFHGPTTTGTIAPGQSLNTTVNSGSFSITDQAPPSPKAFYLLEAEFVP